MNQNISAFLTGKTIFITGATGFLGQAILEKILWVAPQVKQISLLIRPKRQSGGGVSPPQERLEREIFQSSVFDRLRAEHGDRCLDFLREKLLAVGGDVGEKDLGLDPQTRAWLYDEVDIIINSAALVSFDAPLDEALEQNVLSAQRLTEFATHCKKAIFVHVSTAYVSGATSENIPETMYHLAEPGESTSDFPTRRFANVDRDIQHIRQVVARVHREAYAPELDRELKEALIKHFRKSRSGKNVRRREKIENLRRKWIKNRLVEEGMKWARRRGWNDTYTYTKAMGEQMVLRERDSVPTVIVRPSVIESSLAEPNPGWLDGLRMADPLIAAIGKGRLKALPLNPEVTIDLVPVDLVVNALLASIPKTAREGGLKIYQVATGSQNPISLGQLYELIYRYFIKNPLLDKNGNSIRIKRLKFPNPAQFRLQHRLKKVPLSTAERTLEKWPALATHKFKRRISAFKAAHEKLYYYGEIYEPYLNLACRFEINNTLALFNSLPEPERKLFNFDVTQLNWRHYIQNVHIPGVKKYIMKMEGGRDLEVEEPSSSLGPPISTINELIERSAARFPHKTAVQIKRNGEWQRFSFSDLREKARVIGRKFLAAGLQKGDRVVLYSENQPEWGIAYLGACSIGLVVVPLDPQTAHWEVWSVARFTKGRAILASESCFANFKSEDLEKNAESESPILFLNIDKFCEVFGNARTSPHLPIPPGPPPGPDDLASIIFTTGTAVDPKGAMHTHRNFLNNLFGVNRYLPVYETDNFLSLLPLYHALEFTCGFLMPIYGGATVTYMRALKPKIILETMRETGATCMLGVPTLYALIRDDIERRIARTSQSTLKSNFMATSKQLSKSVERTFGKNIGRHLFARIHQEFGGKIRVFVSGGSALGEQLYDDFKALGMPIYEGYGLTETAPVLTVNPFKRSRRGSAGKPLAGVELRISHPDKNGIGEIIVRSPSLMVGYYNNPEATAKVIRDGWFHTGDLGWLDENGYLYFSGRIKDVIVTGAGKNVYPADLEAIYKQVPEIKEICVLGAKNVLTEDVHAVISPNVDRLTGMNPDEIKKAIQRQIQKIARDLPSYQRLQYLHVWPERLPQTSSGEIDRRAVRQKLLDALSEQRAQLPADQAQAPSRKQNREEELLNEISRLTRVPVEKITRESNLQTDLGLDSLMTIELLLFVEHHFGISVPDEKAVGFQSAGDMLKALRVRSQRMEPSKEASKAARLRSVLPYSERSALNRCLLGVSFSSLKAFYRLYFDLKLCNSGSLPHGNPYIIAANHSSHLDTGAIISAMSTALGTKEAQKLHILGASDYFFDKAIKRWFFTTFLNVVPIEREETSLAGLRMVKRILSGGEPVLIFPEGTRSRTGQMQRFKPGLGLIAWELKVPIVPAYIEGTYESMPAGKMVPKPTPVKVIFGEPITMDSYRSKNGEPPTDELYRKIAADVRSAIEKLRHSESCSGS